MSNPAARRTTRNGPRFALAAALVAATVIGLAAPAKAATEAPAGSAPGRGTSIAR